MRALVHVKYTLSHSRPARATVVLPRDSVRRTAADARRLASRRLRVADRPPTARLFNMSAKSRYSLVGTYFHLSWRTPRAPTRRATRPTPPRAAAPAAPWSGRPAAFTWRRRHDRPHRPRRRAHVRRTDVVPLPGSHAHGGAGGAAVRAPHKKGSFAPKGVIRGTRGEHLSYSGARGPDTASAAAERRARARDTAAAHDDGRSEAKERKPGTVENIL